MLSYTVMCGVQVLEDHRDVPFLGRHLVHDLLADPERPLEMLSRPATIRSAVVLPHPEGPTSTMNSPSPMSRSSVSTAFVPSG